MFNPLAKSCVRRLSVQGSVGRFLFSVLAKYSTLRFTLSSFTILQFHRVFADYSGVRPFLSLGLMSSEFQLELSIFR